ncbi:hypothetical protein [Curtobacterium pusillum]|uniref:hypothetical protein n=1 Tax=Curtobacterium pusillum TaxID=69373 RepID=UPI0011AA1035|nr:hypothetical protein [Curtobacterium pusillum]
MTRRLAVLAATGAVVAACAGAGATAAAVAAPDWRPVPETGTPGRLVLHTGPEPLTLPDAAHDTGTWQVRTDVLPDGPVVLDLEIRKDGALASAPGGLVVAVSFCDRPLRATTGTPACGPGATALVRATTTDDRAASSPVVRIPDPDGDGTAYLLVRTTLADRSDPELPGATGRLGIGVTARSEDPATGAPRSVLASTGAAVTGPVLVALAAVLAGVALRTRRRPRAGESAP